jgi:hypothetical protein
LAETPDSGALKIRIGVNAVLEAAHGKDRPGFFADSHRLFSFKVHAGGGGNKAFSSPTSKL